MAIYIEQHEPVVRYQGLKTQKAVSFESTTVLASAQALTAGGGAAALQFGSASTTNPGVYFGSGAPSITAPQGSLYLRSDGSSTSTRLYVNTTGSTTWTNVTTAA